MVDSIGPGRDWGGTLSGELGRALEYNAGVFEGDSRTSHNRAGTTAAARLVLKPSGWFDLGGSFSQGDVAAFPVSPGTDPSPKGLDGTSGTGYEFFPGVYVNGRRRRWGVDARLQGGPVSLWGEFLEAREERKGQGPTQEDLPDVYGRGWSATATWLVTGERKARTIRPGRGLFAGPGAVELSARYEELWFDDVSNDGFESAGQPRRERPPRGHPSLHGRPELVADAPSCASRATCSSSATTTRCGRPSPGTRETTSRCSAASRCTCHETPARPLVVAARALCALAACGGGGGAPSDSSVTSTPVPGVPTGGAPIFDPTLLHDARIEIDPSAWQALRENFQSNEYYAANFSVDGVAVAQVGIRSRGDGSRSEEKPGLKVDFNKYVPSQEYYGYKTLVIDNLTQDASMLRERLAFLVFEAMGIASPRNAHARLTVNGRVLGAVRARRAGQQAVPQEPPRRGERQSLRLRVARVLRLPLARRESRGVRAAALPARDERGPRGRRGRRGGLRRRPSTRRRSRATPRRSGRASTSTAS